MADRNPIPSRSHYRIDRDRIENALYREELRDEFTKPEEAPASYAGVALTDLANRIAPFFSLMKSQRSPIGLLAETEF